MRTAPGVGRGWACGEEIGAIMVNVNEKIIGNGLWLRLKVSSNHGCRCVFRPVMQVGGHDQGNCRVGPGYDQKCL